MLKSMQLLLVLTCCLLPTLLSSYRWNVIDHLPSARKLRNYQLCHKYFLRTQKIDDDCGWLVDKDMDISIEEKEQEEFVDGESDEEFISKVSEMGMFELCGDIGKLNQDMQNHKLYPSQLFLSIWNDVNDANLSGPLLSLALRYNLETIRRSIGLLMIILGLNTSEITHLFRDHIQLFLVPFEDGIYSRLKDLALNLLADDDCRNRDYEPSFEQEPSLLTFKIRYRNNRIRTLLRNLVLSNPKILLH